jgi:hypothetical protein
LPLSILDQSSSRIEIIGYENNLFTNAPRALRGMGLGIRVDHTLLQQRPPVRLGLLRSHDGRPGETPREQHIGDGAISRRRDVDP